MRNGCSNGAIGEGLFEKMAFEQGTEIREGPNRLAVRGNSVLHGGNSTLGRGNNVNSFEIGQCLAC